MKMSIIALSSITYAVKAKTLLNDLGMYCEILRTPSDLSKGCGYSIKVRENVNKVLSILNKNSFVVKDYKTYE